MQRILNPIPTSERLNTSRVLGKLLEFGFDRLFLGVDGAIEFALDLVAQILKNSFSWIELWRVRGCSIRAMGRSW